jgi:hypothetical protein
MAGDGPQAYRAQWSLGHSTGIVADPVAPRECRLRGSTGLVAGLKRTARSGS